MTLSVPELVTISNKHDTKGAEVKAMLYTGSWVHSCRSTFVRHCFEAFPGGICCFWLAS